MLFRSLVCAAALVGTAFSSPAPSKLQERNLLGQVIDALNLGLVSDNKVFLTLATLTNNLVSINFDVKNVLPFELTIDSISVSAGLNGTVFAAFNHTFSGGASLKPVVVPGFGGTKNSGNITNVLLTQGVDKSLAIVPFGVLDLINVDVNVRALTILGFGGTPLQITGLKQASVPTTYSLDLS
ncbi:hypothetical protein MIND_00405700 [Mycena indigotica]|uniref:Secreted protein n=1 Tax=Mycena indigotica TaxID=2126181 RepID=A0A8H6T4X5_9AGAR|nr:uncharacterized protein MIND_00405700 [Mycena indigotica]KAF7310316.1 hypothetical protein MIND_00405700 [Mycena indigotica]